LRSVGCRTVEPDLRRPRWRAISCRGALYKHPLINKNLWKISRSVAGGLGFPSASHRLRLLQHPLGIKRGVVSIGNRIGIVSLVQTGSALGVTTISTPLVLYPPSDLVIDFLPFILHVPPNLIAVAALVEEHVAQKKGCCTDQQKQENTHRRDSL
jgi:hypothetical protein